MLDNRPQLRAAPRQVHRRKLALEDGKLQMVPVPAHGLKHLPQPLLIADVVTNQVRGSHDLDHREHAQTIKATSAQTNGTRDLHRPFLRIAPLNLDVKAREALEMVRYAVS